MAGRNLRDEVLRQFTVMQEQADIDARVARVPFPMEVLPPGMRRYVATAALAAGVPPGAVALPMLTLAGGVLGKRARLTVGPGWEELPVVWTMLVGDPGSGKTPALKAARAPFDVVQREAMAAGERPLFATSASVASLGWVLAAAPGVSVVRDELYGLVTRWHRTGSDERQRFLSLWSSEPMVQIARNGAERVMVAEPVVGLVGGVQGQVLKRLGGAGQDGLLERFVPVGVPVARRYWGADGMTTPALDVAAMVEVVRRLRTAAAMTVQMDAAATAMWLAWLNDHTDMSQGVAREAAAAMAKVPAQVARCGLVLQMLWDGGPVIDAAAMSRMVALAGYLRWEVRWQLRRAGVRGQLEGAPGLGERVVRVLTEAGAGCWLERGLLRTRLSRKVAVADLDEALRDLVVAGKVEMQVIRPEGVISGRGRREYRVVGRR